MAPPSRPSSEDAPAPLRVRWSLAVLSGVYAAVWGWAAIELPWRELTAFSIIAAAVAALHALTAMLAAARHRWLRLVWRLQACASLVLLGYLAWGLISAGWYVRSVYGGLGDGVAAAAGVVLGLVILFTVPLAWWGLAATGGVSLKRLGLGALIATVAAGIGLQQLHARSQGQIVASEADASAFAAALTGDWSLPRAAKNSSAVWTQTAVECPDTGRLAAVATYVQRGHGGRPKSVCLRGDDPRALAGELGEVLRAEACDRPIKIDLIAQRAALSGDALIEALAVRPGIDGVCSADGRRCLMPWQLVATAAFNQHTLLAAVPDARIGASLVFLAERLGEPVSERIATHSWSLHARAGAANLRPQTRVPTPAAQLAADDIQRATSLAQRYIERAQQRGGRFRYLISPYNDADLANDFSIPRQAGTTMALCELSPSSLRTNLVILRALGALAALETPIGDDRGVLRMVPRGPHGNESIGASALGAVALLQCRRFRRDAGIKGYDDHDALIGRLARMLLQQQRADGSFQHWIATASGDSVNAPPTLYADGQAVLALVLLEEIASESAGVFPPRAELHSAVDRAMDYFGNDYWDHFLAPFFFIEENWHCLAARAALGHHRHDAYERFCIDYVSFKHRLLHTGGVHDDFLGGYGFGNVVPPHNTATAGYGEALAAAIAILRARSEDSSWAEDDMRAVMAFLLKNQWSREACYACDHPNRVVGAFSEHMASPQIRIDYVQHAWAALGHGARVLALEKRGDG